jgi:hypothetical protein
VVAIVVFICVSSVSRHRTRAAAAAATRRAATFVHATAPVQGMTVQEAAATIAEPTGRPSIVIIYGTHCSITAGMFSEFAEMAARHPEVDVHAFDDSQNHASEIPAFLRKHGADFTPRYLYDWRKGQLFAAMAPLGIKVDSIFTLPLVAIRDRNGRVVMQGDAMDDVKGMERALEKLRQR